MTIDTDTILHSIEDIEAARPSRPDAPTQFTGDDTATWVYWGPSDPSDIPNDWVWERLRNRRNVLLAYCDYRVIPDAPWDTAPWLVYRQALRQLPDSTADPRAAVWPVAPH